MSKVSDCSPSNRRSDISRYASKLSQTFHLIHLMVSDFFSCVIFGRPANQPHDGPLGLVVIMNIRSFKIPRSEVSRHPIIVPWNLSRKIRIFSNSKPFFEVVCHNDLLTIKCFSTLWTKDELYLARTVTVFTKHDLR